MKKSFDKLKSSMKFYSGSDKGTPYISDGDSARVLFFFNLSGAYDGNERLEEAKEDAKYITHAVNQYEDLIKQNNELAQCLKKLADEAFKNMNGGAGHLIDNAYHALAMWGNSK